LSSTLASASGPLEDFFYKGKAVPLYGKARTPRQQEILDKFKDEHLAESLAQLVHSTVRLKRDLGIGFTSCGKPNAFYRSQKSTITFCLEMIEQIMQQLDADHELSISGNLAAKQKLVVGTIYGIFLHELGHAVLDINRVPITGREEDVADQFSLFYAIRFVEPRGVHVVFPTVWFFRSLEKHHDLASEDVARAVMSDEHSLDAQRTYNLACWAIGANERTGEPVARYVNLPDKRRARCPAEYARIDDGMRRLFGKYFVAQPK